MKVYLAADHAGYKLKEKIKQWLEEWGYDYEDMGAFEYKEQDDYPDFIRVAAQKVAEDPVNNHGIVLGGSGQGEAIVCNRYAGVRAVVYYGPSCAKASEGKGLEIIRLSREHNNANVLSLGARFISEGEAKEAIKLWLELSFPGEERHKRRIEKIDAVFSNPKMILK